MILPKNILVSSLVCILMMSMVEHVTLHHVYKLITQTRFTMSYHLKTGTKQSQPPFFIR